MKIGYLSSNGKPFGERLMIRIATSEYRHAGRRIALYRYDIGNRKGIALIKDISYLIQLNYHTTALYKTNDA